VKTTYDSIIWAQGW